MKNKEYIPFFKHFKFIPTEKNNPIGIIINPHSADVYENVISFINNDGIYSESLRNTFVGRELFNNTSWQDLFKLIESNAELTSDVKATFKVSYDDFKKLYPNQPASALLNKDYGILQININNQTSEYLFYQIENTYADPTNEGTYIFEASLDIYMTYGQDIKTKEGTSVFVKRAHIDRLDERGFYNFDFNNVNESYFSGVEPDFRNTLSNFGPNWESTTFTVIGNNETERSQLEKYLNSIKWEYFYRLVTDTVKGSNLKYFEYSQMQGFRIYFGGYITHPEIKDWTLKLVLSGYSPIEIQPNIERNNYSKIIDDNDLVRNHITNYFPFPINSEIIFDYELKEIRFIISTPDIAYNINTDNYDSIPYFINIQTIKSILQPIQLPVPHIVGIDSPSSISMETTLFNTQFFKIEYGIANHTFAEFGLDYLILDHTLTHQISEVYMGYSFQPDINEEWITYSEFFKGYNEASHNFYKSSHGSMRVLSNDNYDAYLKTSQASSMTSAGFKAGMATLGAGIGMYKGFGKDRGFGRGGGLATGALIAGGLSGVASEIATRIDLKNKPDELKGGDNIAMYDDWNKNGITMYYTWKSLNKANLLQVYSFVQKYGKEVNTFLDFNEIIKSRFYYNFVQCEGLFNLLDNQLSTKIKQQMDTDFKKGIRFWHYRNSNTFKGVGNYQYENLEMSMLNKSYIKIDSLSASQNNIFVNLQLYNDTRFNPPSLVVEYSLDNVNWTALTTTEISAKSFTITGLSNDTLYSVYVRTNNPSYLNEPVQKKIRTARANLNRIKIALPTYGKEFGSYSFTLPGNITYIDEFYASDVGVSHERVLYCMQNYGYYGSLPCSTNTTNEYIGGEAVANNFIYFTHGAIRVRFEGNVLYYDLKGQNKAPISFYDIPYPFSSDIMVQYEIPISGENEKNKKK